MGVSSCTGPKEWKGVADCNAGGRAHSVCVFFVSQNKKLLQSEEEISKETVAFL